MQSILAAASLVALLCSNVALAQCADTAQSDCDTAAPLDDAPLGNLGEATLGGGTSCHGSPGSEGWLLLMPMAAFSRRRSS